MDPEPLRGNVGRSIGVSAVTTEEVASGTKGLAEAERLLPIGPNLKLERRLVSSRRALQRFSFSSLFHPATTSLASSKLRP